ncbi:hypothetical protein BB558_000807 [Smittium angustum]|uniref:EF-hand domain-containing protein n=1 Tax=Smittium angustum TaxID=133377 RepID=A0A2U1JD72_SMIAN|nr:hypothetical protein BB558_000807 [Smittium angustum]
MSKKLNKNEPDLKIQTENFETDPAEKSAKLLDENMDLSDKFADALKEIFNRYDLDRDGALNDKEIEAFAQFTNGNAFSEAELNEIKLYLNCNDEGHLTLSGFYELYSLQASSGDEEETWNDLIKHGYNKQLERKSI